MFTDESRFALEPDDKRIWIWRKQGTRNQPQNITEHHAFRGENIMVSNIVDDYLESEGIGRMAWQAYSPVLNPIENLWDALGRAVSSHFQPPATLIELETTLQEWRLLNSAVVDHLIESMLRRRKLNKNGYIRRLANEVKEKPTELKRFDAKI
ncbi:transposable element Tcb1 transposase [Trichonephila clavipes]|nr:transposable element Tcb1 transposase [Trichonephila clavipes]